ncbi:amidase [Ekhidna sp. To15]|uniref:amidase n=1 Tax=Ekhidna sp. To15 TaxID=3395267 RepID=UPI003F51D3B6
MKRRNFIQLSAITGAIPFLGIKACVSPIQENANELQEEQPFELEEWSVGQLSEAMESGKYTSRQICELYLARIQEKDQSENGLNSVIEVNPDALDIADNLDKERSEGKVRGPLHGIPIMIKDNIDTGDKMMTTAGSMALAGSSAPDDAFIVKKLRESGAVLLGKTNLSEWANFRSFRSSSGWSGRGRQTRNPYALDRNPCGSSSGSGSAVSGNMCAITIGTETNGSIVCPSSANGVVGIKPTVGLWSRDGIIPISETQDTAGPMGRSVADAATLLGALAGADKADPRTDENEGNSYTDYTQFLDANGLQGKRIGVLDGVIGYHERVDEIMERAFAAMEAQGATLVKDIKVSESGAYGNSGLELLLYEFKDGLNKYLASRTDAKVKTLADVIQFNKDNADVEMPYFPQGILERAEMKGPLSDVEYKEALETVTSVSRNGIDNALKENKLDAIIGVTGGPAWPIDVINGDHFGTGSSTPAARSGYPNITVPAGYVHGLPVGMSIFGGKYQEPKLISIAYAFEQATKVRKAPKLLPTLQLP